MGEFISMVPSELRAHASSLGSGADGIIAQNDSLTSRMGSLNPGGGGPDADAIQQEYYDNAMKILQATRDAGSAVKELAQVIGLVGNKVDADEAARAASNLQLADGLDPQLPNYDPKLGGGGGVVVNLSRTVTVAPVVGHH